MFNSELLDCAKEMDGGQLDYDNPIVKAVYDTHNEIIQFEIDLWNDVDPSDKGFEEHFIYDFPPGFIRRDINRAKQIIYDLSDIASGETIRHELAPIYTYVMYHLLYRWSEIEFDENGLQDKLPNDIKEYLKAKKISRRSEIYHGIKAWFCKKYEIAYDFADVYDEDHVDEGMAETVATIYLDDDNAKEKLSILGADIDEIFDLLPNDLYERVKKKRLEEKEKHMLMDDMEKTNMDRPTAFISYSWEDESHIAWVKSLADRLIADGINVNVDQYDLSLGDRLPHFMERQITEANYVLIICTPTYKKKSDARKGGVGYEGHIISAELCSTNNERKFIPVIRKGTIGESMPIFLAGKYGIDLCNNEEYEEHYKELVSALRGKKKKPSIKRDNVPSGEYIVKIKQDIENAIIDRSWVKTKEDRQRLAREPHLKIRVNNIILQDEMVENPDYNNGLIKAEPYDLYDYGVLVWNPIGLKKVKVKKKGGTETSIVEVYATYMIPYNRISAVDRHGSVNNPYPTLYCQFDNGTPYTGIKYIDKDTGIQYDQVEIIDEL